MRLFIVLLGLVALAYAKPVEEFSKDGYVSLTVNGDEQELLGVLGVDVNTLNDREVIASEKLLPKESKPEPEIVPEHPIFVPENPAVIPEYPAVIPEFPMVIPEHPILVPEKPIVIPEYPVVIPEIPVIIPEHPIIALPKLPIVMPEHPIALIPDNEVIAVDPQVPETPVESHPIPEAGQIPENGEIYRDDTVVVQVNPPDTVWEQLKGWFSLIVNKISGGDVETQVVV